MNLFSWEFVFVASKSQKKFTFLFLSLSSVLAVVVIIISIVFILQIQKRHCASNTVCQFELANNEAFAGGPIVCALQKC